MPTLPPTPEPRRAASSATTGGTPMPTPTRQTWPRRQGPAAPRLPPTTATATPAAPPHRPLVVEAFDLRPVPPCPDSACEPW